MNNYLKTVIVAPITSKLHGNIPTRVKITLQWKTSYVALDQLRTLDKMRLYKHVDGINSRDTENIKNILLEMFS